MSVPQHVAIIMDGNGRWARRRHRPRLEGHRAGLKAIRRVMEACDDLGIPILSLYAFSTENWSRPRAEVRGLMRLFSETLDREIRELNERGVQVRVTGRRAGLSPGLIKKIEWAEDLTRHNQRRILNLLINYGGRAEIVDAARTFTGETDEEFRANLYAPDMHDPDLIIRTSGEQRISNYLLWQGAYAELVFRDELWPDFTREAFEQSLAEFSARHRRFGGR